MSIVLDFHERRQQQLRGPMLAQSVEMADAIEAAEERLDRGDRPADVLTDLWLAGAHYARVPDWTAPDPQSARALDVLDELAARRTRQGGDAS